MPNCSCRLGLSLSVDGLVRTCIPEQRVADLGIRVHAVYDARLSGAMLNNNHILSGGWLVLLIVAIVVDAGHWGGGGATYRRR
jgi:hypothetical protein